MELRSVVFMDMAMLWYPNRKNQVVNGCKLSNREFRQQKIQAYTSSQALDTIRIPNLYLSTSAITY